MDVYVFSSLGVLVILLGFIVAQLCLKAGSFFLLRIPILHTPVFVRSSAERLATMLQLPQIQSGDRLLDMGSGDGKVVIALAKRFPKCTVVGVEFNPLLVQTSKNAIKAACLDGRITIVCQSFWKTDLSNFDVVFLYGTSYIMEKLEKKVRTEMRPGTQFVSNYFKFPTLKPKKTIAQVRLYFIK